MHYPDESYVRLYTRKTLTNRMLKWEGRAVLQAMLGGEEFDRAGVFQYRGDPAECIATVTELPIEIVRIGLERLLATETWTLTAEAIVWPAYVEAQTCARSDKVRQQESRRRRAANAVTPRAPAVTPCHEPSREVTPSRSDPDQTELLSSDARERDGDGELEHKSEPPPSHQSELRWKHFPKGWREWSLETSAEAAALGLTTADLAGHVAYWTLRDFSGGTVNDLDGELRRALPGIVARKRAAASPAARPEAASSSNPYAWAPTQEHRAFAKSHDLALQPAVDAYRATGLPDKLGTLRAHDDFTRRLRHWHETGGFVPTGPLPRLAKGAA